MVEAKAPVQTGTWGDLFSKMPPSQGLIAMLLAVMIYLLDNQNSQLQSYSVDLEKKVSTEVFSSKMEVINVKYDSINDRIRSLEGKMDQLLALKAKE